MTEISAYFTRLHGWRLPSPVLPASLTEMARDGVKGREGIALWLGKRAKGIASVTHVVGLRGAGVQKLPDQIRIAPWLLNEVTDAADRLGLVLVGQIHSHGIDYGVDLSFTDRTFGIQVPYYLSVVAPDYGLGRQTSLYDCGVHIYEPESGFRRLQRDEIDSFIAVTDTPVSPVTIIGDDNFGER